MKRKKEREEQLVIGKISKLSSKRERDTNENLGGSKKKIPNRRQRHTIITVGEKTQNKTNTIFERENQFHK